MIEDAGGASVATTDAPSQKRTITGGECNLSIVSPDIKVVLDCLSRMEQKIDIFLSRGEAAYDR